MKLFLMLFMTLFCLTALADSPGSIGVRRSVGVPAALDTSSTSVTSSAYVTFIASTAFACSSVQLHNSGAQPIKIAVGAAGSEVDIGEVFPIGVSILVPEIISKGVRISVKSIGGTQSSGILTWACFQ